MGGPRCDRSRQLRRESGAVRHPAWRTISAAAGGRGLDSGPGGGRYCSRVAHRASQVGKQQHAVEKSRDWKKRRRVPARCRHRCHRSAAQSSLLQKLPEDLRRDRTFPHCVMELALRAAGRQQVATEAPTGHPHNGGLTARALGAPEHALRS